MNRRLLIVIALVCVVGAVWIYVRPMAGSAVGLAARQACSLHIGAGIALPLARATYIDRHVRPIGPYIDITIDQTAAAAHAYLLGVASATAVHRDGYGCVLDHGLALTALTPYPLPKAEAGVINQAEKSTRFDSSALDTVIADAFEEPSPSEPRQTMAVLVLSNGQLVAQKYVTGISPDTPLPGFSMAKSMTATMIGLLVQHKNLDVMSVLPDAGQLTAAGTTYDDLLRMVSGIGVTEDGSGRDGNSIMLTQRHDAAGYAVQQDMHAEPGEQYAYTGGNSVVLAQQFVKLAGDGNPSKAYAFLAEKLLKPLKLSSVVLETDGVGTFLGSSFMLASALDWAKLGKGNGCYPPIG